MAARVDAHRSALLRRLRALLEQGLARRGGPAVDPDLFARGVFTLAEGAARLLLAEPERWRVEHVTDITRTLLAALSRDPG
jgi:DNA-binding Lrp family transcriptional regulator